MNLVIRTPATSRMHSGVPMDVRPPNRACFSGLQGKFRCNPVKTREFFADVPNSPNNFVAIAIETALRVKRKSKPKEAKSKAHFPATA